VSGLLVLALSLAAPEARLGETEPTCVVPEGRVVAAVEVDGVVVRAREGALEVDGLRLTPCEGLPGAHPSALAVFDDALYVGFRAAGLHRYVDGRFERVAGVGDRAVRALAPGADALWVGTDRGLMRVASLGRCGRVATRRAARARQPISALRSLPISSDIATASHLELGRRARTSLGRLVCRGVLAAQSERHWVLGRRETTALHVAVDGALHVGAGPYGWWRVAPKGQAARVDRGAFTGCFDERDGRVRAHAPGRACRIGPAEAASGLPSGHVTTLVAHLGEIYVGTFDAGLARLEGDRFVPVRGAPRFVNALLSDGPSLHIGTPKGLFRLERTPSADVVRRAPVALPSQHVNGLARGRDGTLWVATGGGLVGIGPTGVRVIDASAGLPGRIVYAVAIAGDGAVWAGTAGGAARIATVDDAAGGRVAITAYTHAGGQLPHDWVNALLPDGDAILAGTYDAGVWRLTPDGVGRPVRGLEAAWVNPGGLARMGEALLVSTLGGGLLIRRGGAVLRQANLPSQDVTSILRHRGSLWIGTRGGLARL